MFATREIRKRYTALLDGMVEQDEGIIDLPLCPDYANRPRQMVNFEHGKPAVTRYEVLANGKRGRPASRSIPSPDAPTSYASMPPTPTD